MNKALKYILKTALFALFGIICSFFFSIDAEAGPLIINPGNGVVSYSVTPDQANYDDGDNITVNVVLEKGYMVTSCANTNNNNERLRTFNFLYNAGGGPNMTVAIVTAQRPIDEVDVTFKVVNGAWNDGTRGDKIKEVWRYHDEDGALLLQAEDIPGVGNRPDAGYAAGSWDVEPPLDNLLNLNNPNPVFTYTYDGSGVTTYTITFDANGGIVSPASGTTDVAGKLSSLPVPKRNGYDFKGWFTAKSGGRRVNLATVFTSNDTIYAHWGESVSEETEDEPSEYDPGDNTVQTSDKKDEEPVNYLDELRTKLKAAISRGGEQTVTWDKGTALPYDIMKTLQDNPKITLVFSYIYKGTGYKITIPGSLAKADTSIPWYGPVYLFANYGGLDADALSAAPSTTQTQTYTVKPGDTLSKIASELKTTVNDLVTLNGIQNRDKIKPGQVLKYWDLPKATDNI